MISCAFAPSGSTKGTSFRGKTCPAIVESGNLIANIRIALVGRAFRRLSTSKACIGMRTVTERLYPRMAAPAEDQLDTWCDLVAVGIGQLRDVAHEIRSVMFWCGRYSKRLIDRGYCCERSGISIRCECADLLGDIQKRCRHFLDFRRYGEVRADL
jgi:uncharacterized protein YeaO (DUF488 family)